MTLIKCPQCGQTVLSVASVCPKCGFLLLQPPPPRGEERAFITCRRCDKVVPRGAQTCPYCGYPQQFRRRVRLIGGIILGAAALAAGFIGFGLRQSGDEQLRTETEPVTPPAVTPQPAPSAAEIRVPPPPTATRTAADTAPSRPAQTVATPPATARPRGSATVARWTVTWANVRDAPALEGLIVGVLRPGSRVDGERVRGGWWAVYQGDSLVGYVASSLLADHLLPPESLGIGRE